MQKVLSLVSLIILVVFFTHGCSDAESSRSYPSSWMGVTGISSNSRVTVKIGNKNPYVGKTIPIVIGVFDSAGSPIPESAVTMSSDNSGSFEENELETDERGYVNAVFTPSKAGTTLIMAAANGHFGTAAIQVFPSIFTGSVVTLFASSDVVETDGLLIIKVHCTDDSGTDLDSAPVNLLCESGTLSEYSGTTLDGWFTTEYTAPSTTGSYLLTAMIYDTIATKTVSVR